MLFTHHVLLINILGICGRTYITYKRWRPLCSGLNFDCKKVWCIRICTGL